MKLSGQLLVTFSFQPSGRFGLIPDDSRTVISRGPQKGSPASFVPTAPELCPVVPKGTFGPFERKRSHYRPGGQDALDLRFIESRDEHFYGKSSPSVWESRTKLSGEPFWAPLEIMPVEPSPAILERFKG